MTSGVFFVQKATLGSVTGDHTWRRRSSEH